MGGTRGGGAEEKMGKESLNNSFAITSVVNVVVATSLNVFRDGSSVGGTSRFTCARFYRCQRIKRAVCGENRAEASSSRRRADLEAAQLQGGRRQEGRVDPRIPAEVPP